MDANHKPEMEELEEAQCCCWSGFDAMLAWIGGGVFALLLLIGLGQCQRAVDEGFAVRGRAKQEQSKIENRDSTIPR